MAFSMVAVDASRTDVLRQGQRDLFAIRNALPRRLVQSSQAAYGSDPSGSPDVDWEGCCERITRCGGAPRSLVRGSAFLRRRYPDRSRRDAHGRRPGNILRRRASYRPARLLRRFLRGAVLLSSRASPLGFAHRAGERPRRVPRLVRIAETPVTKSQIRSAVADLRAIPSRLTPFYGLLNVTGRYADLLQVCALNTTACWRSSWPARASVWCGRESCWRPFWPACAWTCCGPEPFSSS